MAARDNARSGGLGQRPGMAALG